MYAGAYSRDEVIDMFKIPPALGERMRRIPLLPITGSKKSKAMALFTQLVPLGAS